MKTLHFLSAIGIAMSALVITFSLGQYAQNKIDMATMCGPTPEQFYAGEHAVIDSTKLSDSINDAVIAHKVEDNYKMYQERIRKQDTVIAGYERLCVKHNLL